MRLSLDVRFRRSGNTKNEAAFRAAAAAVICIKWWYYGVAIVKHRKIDTSSS